jgi:hypothetical protein
MTNWPELGVCDAGINEVLAYEAQHVLHFLLVADPDFGT